MYILNNNSTYINGNLSHLPVALHNNFTSERCHGNLDEVLPRVLVDGEGFADGVQMREGRGRRHLEAVGDADRVDSFVEEDGGLLQ